MLIKTAKLSGKTYSLTDATANQSKNNFSVIIGVNGVGKSRLLSQIASSIKGASLTESIPKGKTQLLEVKTKDSFIVYGKSNEKSSYILKKDCAHREYFENLNVIAVTTSPFDRFPVSYRGRQKYKYSDNQRFHYIGLRVSENNFNKTNLLNLFSRSLMKQGMSRPFKSVFNLLGYNAKVRVEFKSKIPPHIIESIFLNVGKYSKGKEQKNFLLGSIGKYSEGLVERIKDDNQAISGIVKSLANNFRLGDKSVTISKPLQTNKDLMLLLDMGVIYVKRIELHSKSNRVVEFSESSSGEQCLLLSLFNLAGVIKNHSVVCIDEPEISLHPSWQRRYIKLLKECFSSYKGCHFILSTHSPLIVSELDEADCHVLNMAENKIYPAKEYIHQSVDYQLAELFDTPGDNNEYLKRRAITLLSKNSKEKGLSENEKKESRKLISIGDTLSENDIVKQLVALLEKGIKERSVK